jgi:hypothetical protein
MNDVTEIGLMLFMLGTMIGLWAINQRLNKLEKRGE